MEIHLECGGELRIENCGLKIKEYVATRTGHVQSLHNTNNKNKNVGSAFSVYFCA